MTDLVGGVPVCKFCDVTANFKWVADTCVCDAGHKLVNRRCEINCGDGVFLH